MKIPFLFAIVLVSAITSAAENLLINPDFQGADKGTPAGWKRYSTGLAAPQTVTLDDGKKALKLEDDSSDKGSGYLQILPGEPGAKYELSCDTVAIDGKKTGSAAIQISGRNLPLLPGKNILGVEWKPDQKKMLIFVWTPKKGTGHALVRNLKLRKVENFSPETCINGIRPAALPKKKTTPAARSASRPASDEIVALTDGKQAEFTLPYDGLWQIDAVITSPRHPRFGASVRVSMDGGPWCSSMIRNYNPMDRTLSPMMLLWHYKKGKHVLRYDTYDSVLKDQVRIHEFRIHPFRNVKVPAAAKNYKPVIVPPESRPRVLITAETLPRVRENLKWEPNKTLWEKLLQDADKEYQINVKPDEALGYNATVCKLVRAKFFAFLITQEEKYFQSGRKLLIDYLKRLNFVKTAFYYYNHGEMLYSTALAYDWAYDRFTDEEKKLMRDRMDFFAHTMQTGYPPFAQHITYGHGNGAQSHSYLPAWAIAIYDEDPVPYRYCAYRVLEQLVPQRVMEFSSGRHAEGAAYAVGRFKGDLFSALHYKMFNAGKPVFHPGIDDVYMHFIYNTLPDGSHFNNGDNWTDRGNSAFCAALAAAHSGNPYYVRHMLDVAKTKGYEATPEQLLAWFDPHVKPAESYQKLPLTRYQKGVFSSMNMRTGWNTAFAANDAVLEFNAKEFNLAGHAHRDTGTFQIWYRGLLAGDIGQYKIFGVPYDAGFGKRTVAHSAMLVHDPKEITPGGNDGGQRQGRAIITAAGFHQKENRFADTLAADFGPVAERPLYTLLKTDMTASYPKGRLEKHIRSFYFLNFNDPEFPGAVVVADRVESVFTKYFQVNTPCKVLKTPGGVQLASDHIPGLPGYLSVTMLRPQVTPEILSGKQATNVFGKQYTPPYPERPASRILFPARKGEKDFTCIMQISSGKQYPVQTSVSGEAYTVRIKDWLLAMADNGGLISHPFSFEAAGCVLLADLAPGDWTIEGVGYATVQPGKHTFFAKLPAGKYTIRPGRSGKKIAPCTDQAIPTPELRNKVILNNKRVPGITPVERSGKLYVDSMAVMARMGKKVHITPSGIRLAGREIPLDHIQQQGKILTEAENLGSVLGLNTHSDPAKKLVAYGGNSTMDCFHVASSNGQSALGLFTGKSRWIHNSPTAFFTVRFLEPKQLQGIDLYAVSMQVPFVVEKSDDGKNWQIIAGGETDPVSGILTPIRFAAPQKVDFLRFRFKGSKTHPHWNTLDKIQLLPCQN